MVDARRPGSVIGLVVLGPEWLQAEARPQKAVGNDKFIRDERLSHTVSVRPTRARRSQIVSLAWRPGSVIAPLAAFIETVREVAARPSTGPTARNRSG